MSWLKRRGEQAAAVLSALAETNPRPHTELHYRTPWQLLVAAVLSARTTDRQVNQVTARLFAKYPGPADIAALTPEELAEEIKNIGLFRNKSRHLVTAARAVLDRHGGQVPGTVEELMTLPGVGRKTANVVVSNAFNVPALAVDTHVFRVARRLGLARSKTPEKVERQLTRIIPREMWSDAHHWLILHGRYTCTARSPRCAECPVSSACDHYRTGSAGKKREE
jgi:endonuclease-3